jgi:hypothetical protein
MALMRAWVAAALLGLALFTTGSHHAQAAEADPSVWGVYAQLVGTAWKGEFGTRAVRWGEGNQMIDDDSAYGQSVITPGPTPGTLTLKLGSTGLHTFQGTIASDGSVLWVRDGMLKMPYRMLLRDGQLVEEAVKLSGGEVASVKREMRYQQADGPRLAAQSTPIPQPRPASSAPVKDASMPSGVAAVSAAVVPSTPTSVFGPLGALNGQQFASDTGSLKVHVTSGGRSLTLNGGSAATYILNATDVPGTYSVAAHPNQLHEYHHEDSFVGLLNADGAIEIRYRTRGVSGSKYATDLYRFDGNSIAHERYSENWRGRRMVGSPYTYVPATPELLQAALANAISLTRAHEERVIQNRRAEAARGAMFNSALQGVAEGLAGGSTGGYAEAQANLDATVANIQNAAAVERQQQALAQQQAQARAAEESRQKLAENERWVAEKEQAAAEYRSGQVDAAAAREKQLVAQQQANAQARAAAEVQRRNVEQAATVDRQRLQAAALAERPQVSARPVTAEPAASQPSGAQTSQGSTGSPSSNGPLEMFAFFINLDGKTVDFEGPTAMTRAEGRAKKARLAAEAPGRYGAGAVVKVQSIGGGYCAFVFQNPREGFYVLGGDTDLSTATKAMDYKVKNGKVLIHRTVVCPNNN